MSSGRRVSGVQIKPAQPRRLVGFCLLALAVNAVVIQTVLTDDSIVKMIVRVSVLALAVLGLAVRNVHVPLWLAFGVLWSAVLLVGRQNPDQLSIIFVLTLTLLALQVSEQSLLKAAVVASWVALGLIFALLAIGVTDDVVINLRQRHTYGTAGVPFFYNVVYGALSLTVLYAVKYRHRVYAAVSASLALATYLFQQTDARGGYASLLLFLALLWLVPRVRVTPLYAAVPVTMLAVSVWLAFGATRELNVRLSHRPSLYRRFLDSAEWTDYLISDTAKQVGYAVDNSYLHLLVGAGLVTIVGFFVLFFRAVYALMMEQRFPEVAYLVASSAYCMSESLLVRIENVFIVYTWYLVVRHGGGLSNRHASDVELRRQSAGPCVANAREASASARLKKQPLRFR